MARTRARRRLITTDSNGTQIKARLIARRAAEWTQQQGCLVLLLISDQSDCDMTHERRIFDLKNNVCPIHID